MNPGPHPSNEPPHTVRAFKGLDTGYTLSPYPTRTMRHGRYYRKQIFSAAFWIVFGEFAKSCWRVNYSKNTHLYSLESFSPHTRIEKYMRRSLYVFSSTLREKLSKLYKRLIYISNTLQSTIHKLSILSKRGLIVVELDGVTPPHSGTVSSVLGQDGSARLRLFSSVRLRKRYTHTCAHVLHAREA